MVQRAAKGQRFVKYQKKIEVCPKKRSTAPQSTGSLWYGRIMLVCFHLEVRIPYRAIVTRVEGQKIQCYLVFHD